MPSGEKHKRHFTYTQMNEDLAYLLGVYMGDGSVWIRTVNEKEYGLFQVGSVDIDFLDAILDRVENVLGYRPKKYTNTKAHGNRREIQSLRVCSSQFAIWLRDITENKTVTPEDILDGTPEIKKAYLQALMDSEGYVLKRRVGKTNGSPYVGFAVKEGWAHDVQRMMAEFAHVPEAKLTFGNMWKIRIHPLEYQKMGLSFSIGRKRKIFGEILLDEKLEDTWKPKIVASKRWSHNWFTKAQIQTIKERYLAGGVTYKSIAQEYGVHNATIARLVRNETYHLNED